VELAKDAEVGQDIILKLLKQIGGIGLEVRRLFFGVGLTVSNGTVPVTACPRMDPRYLTLIQAMGQGPKLSRCGLIGAKICYDFGMLLRAHSR
jgi:hypothetical protein